MERGDLVSGVRGGSKRQRRVGTGDRPGMACLTDAAGQVRGRAVDPTSGELHGYVASPVDDAELLNESRRVVRSKAAREKLERFGIGRFGFRSSRRK